MFIKSIEIQGFKSFAQKTLLTFPSRNITTDRCGIACIVGPNGSGKSNLVDAIRWVLGEQSLKSLRGKKSQDVIFSGSEKKGRLGMSEVKIIIDNTAHLVPIDYDEVIISRKMYRDGESQYLINNSKVRLQDILLLAAKANFGQKSYSIVSQGSIDQVIMANPSDRKEYFDEAVGVKEFQIKRDSSINKLENAWNNLLQIDALLTEISPRLNSLTRQVHRLERRAKIEAELEQTQKKYYGWLNRQLTQQVTDLKPKLQTAEVELAKKDQELKAAQQRLSSLEKQDTSNSKFTELQSRYQKLLEQKNKLREEQLMLEHKIEMAKQRQTIKASPLPILEIIKKLKAIASLQDQISKNIESGKADKIGQIKSDTKDLASLIKDLISQLENPQVKEKVATEIDPSFIKDLEAVKKDLGAMEKQLSGASTDIANFNQDQQKQKGEFFDLQRKISDRQNQYNQQASAVSEIRIEMAKLETRQQSLTQEIKDEVKDSGWLKDYQAEKINEVALHEEIIKQRRQLELIGGVDPQVIDEHKKVKDRHDFLSTQADDLRNSIKSLEKIITDLDEKIQVQFDEAFKNINKEFAKFFNTLFGGGKATLTLIKQDPNEVEEKKPTETDVANPQNPDESLLASPSILDQLQNAEKSISPKRFLKKTTGKVITGIDITATPPGKKVSSVNILSGGERSLTAIALICAIIANNPSPFVILDEVDAALDETNSQRFSKILDELSHKTQFIVITHNRATMQKASILYGVTMGDDGISKLLSLQLEEAAKIVRQ
ncbi:MAG: AAA family ATPase [Candidatus Buchananbacteria bacterium]|nr:AAA family ATPase [Candidatus Buchananbacteria bacterium]